MKWRFIVDLEDIDPLVLKFSQMFPTKFKYIETHRFIQVNSMFHLVSNHLTSAVSQRVMKEVDEWDYM